MNIEMITDHNLHLLPDKMDVERIGHVKLSYMDGKFDFKICKFKESILTYFPTSKPKDINEFNALRYGYMMTENGCYVGHMVVQQNFNRTLYIEDFDVSGDYRRTGVAEKFMKFIENEACKQKKGLSLEVQDNNVIAFLFYLKEGFKIGGFDNLFYHNTVQKDENAIYLYKFF